MKTDKQQMEEVVKKLVGRQKSRMRKNGIELDVGDLERYVKRIHGEAIKLAFKVSRIEENKRMRKVMLTLQHCGDNRRFVEEVFQNRINELKRRRT